MSSIDRSSLANYMAASSQLNEQLRYETARLTVEEHALVTELDTALKAFAQLPTYGLSDALAFREAIQGAMRVLLSRPTFALLNNIERDPDTLRWEDDRE